MSRRDDSDSARMALPHSVEAEQAVLGGMMLAPDAYSQVADWLSEEDFYRRDHQLIYRAIKEQAETSQRFDAVTLGDWFESRALSREVANGAYLIELSMTTPSAANIVAYGEIVKEKANLRRGIEIGTALIKACRRTEGRDSGLIVAEATAALTALRGDPKAGGLVPYRSLLPAWYDDLHRRYTEGGLPGLPLPWDEANDALHGLQAGELYTLAARSNMGKTVLAFQIARFLGRHHRGGVFSMEMNGRQIVRRDVAGIGGVPHRWLHKPSESEDAELYWDRIAEALRELKSSRVLVDDSPRLSTAQMAARARRAHLQAPLEFLIVDHMHEADLPGKENETIERGQVAKDLKALAKELNLPIIALAQLNRSGADGKPPSLTALRGAGGIEEASDVVLFLHRPDYYDPDDRPGLVQLIVGKGRDVETGQVINLRNRFDQMRADTWGNREIPTAKARDESTALAMGYGSGRRRSRGTSGKSGPDRAAGEA